MISKVMQKINNYLDDTIFSYKQRKDKNHLLFGILMLTAGVWFSFNTFKEITENRMDYIILLAYSAAFLLIFGLYILILFGIGNSSNKLFTIKKIIFAIVMVIFNIITLPIMIYIVFTKRTKFFNLYKYYDIYVLGFLITFILDIITFLTLQYYLVHVKWLNTDIFSFFITFILSGIFMKAIVWIYFKRAYKMIKKRFRKNKLTEVVYNEYLLNKKEDYYQFKNELYILNFILIAFGTAIIYLFNWEVITPDIKNINKLNENIQL